MITSKPDESFQGFASSVMLAESWDYGQKYTKLYLFNISVTWFSSSSFQPFILCRFHLLQEPTGVGTSPHPGGSANMQKILRSPASMKKKVTNKTFGVPLRDLSRDGSGIKIPDIIRKVSDFIQMHGELRRQDWNRIVTIDPRNENSVAALDLRYIFWVAKSAIH